MGSGKRIARSARTSKFDTALTDFDCLFLFDRLVDDHGASVEAIDGQGGAGSVV